jgi:hypothetical protein
MSLAINDILIMKTNIIDATLIAWGLSVLLDEFL